MVHSTGNVIERNKAQGYVVPMVLVLGRSLMDTSSTLSL